jgi:hypothetical protein
MWYIRDVVVTDGFIPCVGGDMMESSANIPPVEQDIILPYEPPAVIYEAPLEVRAGTPVGFPALIDWNE